MTEIKLGDNIRALRKEKGIAQEALANELGVTIQAVSKWETSGSMPDITLLPEIAAYFGVTIDELFYGKSLTDTSEEPDTAVTSDESDFNTESSESGEINDSQENSFSDSGCEENASGNGTEAERSYTFSDLNDLGKTIGESISEKLRKIKGSSLVFHFDDKKWEKENAVRNDLPDDQTLRVVQFVGNKMVHVDKITPDAPIRLIWPAEEEKAAGSRRVIIYGSADVSGNIGGEVIADGNVNISGNVGGGVRSDGSVNCQKVGGGVISDGDVNCGDVGGSLRSDGDVSCGNVGGGVSADGDVTCSNVKGHVRCEGNINFRK